MTSSKLGRLERVDLRDIWKSEAMDFTPCLAQPDNLTILGDTLGVDLELEAQEKAVGPFRAGRCQTKTRGSAKFVIGSSQAAS
jgi:hypothetical protein